GKEPATDLYEAHDDAGQEGGGDMAEAAEGNRDIRKKGERRSHVGEDVEEHGEKGARRAHAAGPDGPAEGEHPLRVDAHEHGGLAVLGRRLEGQPRLRLPDEPVEEAEGAERPHARHELGQADEDAPEGDAAVDERALDEPEVRAPERLGGGAKEDGKTEGGEDLGEHGSAQDPPDEPVVDEQTEEGQEEDGEGQRDEGIELQEGPRPERGEQ